MLKVINLHHNQQLINRALKKERKAQKELYDKFSPQMLGLCAYYVKDRHNAEEVMLNGFFKAFTKLETFKREGSFEGWLKRIMIYESISFLRKKNELIFTDNLVIYEKQSENNIEQNIAVNELIDLIDELPPSCKVVFNLYVIEGYKHHEISDLLGISEGTSKAQLFRARKSLQQKVGKFNSNQNEIKYSRAIKSKKA